MGRGLADLGLSENQRRQLLHDYETSGFGYCDYPRHNNYGISLTAASWVAGRLEQRPHMRIVTYSEMAWAAFQDVVSVVRRPIEGVRFTEDSRERP
jgi:hypothetical protein